MAYNDFLISLNQPMYRAVAPGRNPQEASLKPSRASWTGTASTCCALNAETAYQEFQKHNQNQNMKMYEILINDLTAVDLQAYCSSHGIAPGDCYAGEIDHTKVIHEFYGQGVQALIWPSNVGPGQSIVFFPENLHSDQKVIVKSFPFLR